MSTLCASLWRPRTISHHKPDISSAGIGPGTINLLTSWSTVWLTDTMIFYDNSLPAWIFDTKVGLSLQTCFVSLRGDILVGVEGWILLRPFLVAQYAPWVGARNRGAVNIQRHAVRDSDEDGGQVTPQGNLRRRKTTVELNDLPRRR